MAGELNKKLREKIPTIAAGATAAATVAILSRFVSTTGTLMGVGLASALFGTISTVYEHGIEKTSEKAKKIREAHLQGIIRKPDEWDNVFGPRKQERDIPWKRITVGVLVMITLCISSATIVEALSHKALAVTGGSVAPPKDSPATQATSQPAAPSPSVTHHQKASPSPSSSSPGPSQSATSSATPSPSSTPGLASTTPGPSPTPSPSLQHQKLNSATPGPSPG